MLNRGHCLHLSSELVEWGCVCLDSSSLIQALGRLSHRQFFSYHPYSLHAFLLFGTFHHHTIALDFYKWGYIQSKVCAFQALMLKCLMWYFIFLYLSSCIMVLWYPKTCCLWWWSWKRRLENLANTWRRLLMHWNQSWKTMLKKVLGSQKSK